MKKMSAAFVLCLLTVATLFVGCGVRGEVAREKVLGRIDSMLGSMDVQRKEIEVSVDALQKALVELRKAGVKAQVKQDQITRKLNLADADVDRYDSTLRNLKLHLTSTNATKIDGRSYTPGRNQPTDSAGPFGNAQASADQRNGFAKANDRLVHVVAMLNRKQSDYQTKITDIQHQLSVIDSNRIALTAMQDAAEAMDGSDSTFAQNVANLEDKVDDLYAEVEAGLMTEDVRWQEDTGPSSVQDVVAALQSSDDLVSQIDQILPSVQVAESGQ